MSDQDGKQQQTSVLRRAWNTVTDWGESAEQTLDTAVHNARDIGGRVLNSANSVLQSAFGDVADAARPYLRQLWSNPSAILPSFSFSTFASAFAQPYRALYDGSAAETRLSRGGNSISRRLNEFENWFQGNASLFNPTNLLTDEGAFSAVFGVKRFFEGGFANNSWDPGGVTAPGGVTRAGHPAAYRDIMALYNQRRFPEMEQYLHDFYKRTYWDRLDEVLQLPEGFRFESMGAKMFAFDIALNHSLTTARNMVQQSGGDLESMISARYSFFSRQDNAGVVGQYNRVTIAGSVGQMVDALTDGHTRNLGAQAVQTFQSIFGR